MITIQISCCKDSKKLQHVQKKMPFSCIFRKKSVPLHYKSIKTLKQ